MRNVILSLIAFMFMLTNATVAWSASQSLTASQRSEVKTIVHDYMLDHPELLKQMAQKLRQQEQEQEKAEANKAIEKHSEALFNAKNDPVLGNPKGSITLIEFMDYQCPHCAHMMPVINKLIDNNQQLRVVVKELPIFSGASYYAAQAALAAQDQGQFKALHKALFKADDKLSKKTIHTIAKSVGLNVKQLKQTIKSGHYDQVIKTNYSLARALGLRGTPAFVIGTNGQNAVYFPGTTDYQAMQSAIDQVKQNAQK